MIVSAVLMVWLSNSVWVAERDHQHYIGLDDKFAEASGHGKFENGLKKYRRLHKFLAFSLKKRQWFYMNT